MIYLTLEMNNSRRLMIQMKSSRQQTNRVCTPHEDVAYAEALLAYNLLIYIFIHTTSTNHTCFFFCTSSHKSPHVSAFRTFALFPIMVWCFLFECLLNLSLYPLPWSVSRIFMCIIIFVSYTEGSITGASDLIRKGSVWVQVFIPITWLE